MKYRMIVLLIACLVLTTFSCEKEELYTLSLTALPTNGGSVSKSPAQSQYESGTSATLTANPASGYQFTRWEGDLTGSSNPATVNINENKNITAVFTEVIIQYTLALAVTPANGGGVAKSPEQNQYNSGTTVTLTANPAPNYQFTKWEGDLTGSANPATVTVNGNKNITAVFTEVVKQYTVTAAVSPSNGGSVTKSPDQDQYDEGTIVNLTANPASDYQFTRWEGDVTGTSNPKTVAMNGNKNVTAIFSEIEKPAIQLSTTDLTFTATEGSSSPPSQTVSIINSGSGTLSGLSKSFPDGTPLWLSASLNGSTAPTELTVSVSMSSPLGGAFGAGTYTTRIGITSTDAVNSPQYINVTFTIQPTESLTVYASYDNGLLYSSLDPSFEDEVFSNSTIGVGIDYGWTVIDGFYNTAYAASAIKFNLASQTAGRRIKSATLRLYVYALRGDFTLTPKIRVSAFYENWNPNTLTYNIAANMQVYSDGKVEVNAPGNSVLPLDIDVTTIIRNWASGAWNNYGFLLTPQNHYYPNATSLQSTFFQSLEEYFSIDERPQLIIDFQ